MGIIQTEMSAQEFFWEALRRALDHEHVSLSVEAEYYVVQLLAQVDDVASADGEQSLSLRFLQALQARPTDLVTIRSVGDTSLRLSGLWWERELRAHRADNLSCYIALGQNAYGHLGGPLYDELATKFRELVDALTCLGTEHSLATARDVLHLYELWQATHSRHAAVKLVEQGITVIRTPDSDDKASS